LNLEQCFPYSVFAHFTARQINFDTLYSKINVSFEIKNQLEIIGIKTYLIDNRYC